MTSPSCNRPRKRYAIASLVGFLVTRSSPTSAFQQIPPGCPVTPHSSRPLPSAHLISQLFAESGDIKSKTNGVYVRPSGAIERGSGFFVPGLEGPRVRFVFGGLLLALTALNHVLVQAATVLSLEEQITIFYSVLVLFQAAIEFRKEELIVEGISKGGTSTGRSGNSSNRNSKTLLKMDLVQKWNQVDQLIQSEKDKIQWAAASYLSVTPATQMLLLSKDSVIYRLGSDGTTDDDLNEEGVTAALEQLSRSKGGRIALPDSHPAVIALGLQSARTVVLQRISEESCWVMSSSDQLLASFTTADLKWLGQLARYIAR